MKTIQEILDNYEDYSTFMEDRFGRRLCAFLTEEQGEQIGYTLSDAAKAEGREWNAPIAWTEENVISQLKRDLQFGFEKCCDERGISSELMCEVCRAWCRVLENGLENVPYGWYGRTFFKTVAERYGLDLAEE